MTKKSHVIYVGQNIHMMCARYECACCIIEGRVRRARKWPLLLAVFHTRMIVQERIKPMIAFSPAEPHFFTIPKVMPQRGAEKMWATRDWVYPECVIPLMDKLRFKIPFPIHGKMLSIPQETPCAGIKTHKSPRRRTRPNSVGLEFSRPSQARCPLLSPPMSMIYFLNHDSSIVIPSHAEKHWDRRSSPRGMDVHQVLSMLWKGVTKRRNRCPTRPMTGRTGRGQ